MSGWYLAAAVGIGLVLVMALGLVALGGMLRWMDRR